jgi:hypothetical protein
MQGNIRIATILTGIALAASVSTAAVRIGTSPYASAPNTSSSPVSSPVASSLSTPAIAPAAPRDAAVRVVRPAPVVRAAVVRRTRPAPRRVASKPLPRATHVSAPRHYPSGPTSWGALNAAIARIPTYHAGAARWVIETRGGWGLADWYQNIIYISPSVPDRYLYSVAVHEWSHLLSIHAYGGNVPTAVAAMTRYFGASSIVSPEYAADCMALLQGATWTDYTSCTSSKWQAGARALVAGAPLPAR